MTLSFGWGYDVDREVLSAQRDRRTVRSEFLRGPSQHFCLDVKSCVSIEPKRDRLNDQ
jgi:hypothetical protein